MNKYKQLTKVQRYQIEALNKTQKDQKGIAEIIGVFSLDNNDGMHTGAWL